MDLYSTLRLKCSNLIFDDADKFRNVSCSFEDSNFNCGYTTSQLGEWQWMRKTGKDDNTLTGPETDDLGNALG